MKSKYIPQPKTLFFAGLARDCANNLQANLNSLISIINTNNDYDCKMKQGQSSMLSKFHTLHK